MRSHTSLNPWILLNHLNLMNVFPVMQYWQMVQGAWSQSSRLLQALQSSTQSDILLQTAEKTWGAAEMALDENKTCQVPQPLNLERCYQWSNLILSRWWENSAFGRPTCVKLRRGDLSDKHMVLSITLQLSDGFEQNRPECSTREIQGLVTSVHLNVWCRCYGGG